MKLKHIFTLLICCLTLTPIMSAQTPLGKNEAIILADAVSENYTSWQTVALDGKLSMDRLPISPSLKIFMKKGSIITISIRVPFLGEVGRAQIKGQEILAVNKLKKVYVQEKLGDFFTDLPVTLDDIQNLLLARGFVAGSGEVSRTNINQCDTYITEDGWMIIPKEPIGGSVNYGFEYNSDCRLNLASAVPDGTSIEANAIYTYSGKKTRMDIELTHKSKDYNATLSLNAPEYGASPLGDIDLNKNYKKVSVREFVKSLSF
ncbi:MAG: DUF4292 domain-containing protein [Prevotella sp.]|nr:DUF4292 domain-containing protein [Bacteroides sp.]MCM1367060.1 DUF4292 domain-containing protein [Prevotella sp.]MCM1437041.1 DUF4292 domain-containing protein [Prevotella sp.]